MQIGVQQIMKVLVPLNKNNMANHNEKLCLNMILSICTGTLFYLTTGASFLLACLIYKTLKCNKQHIC